MFCAWLVSCAHGLCPVRLASMLPTTFVLLLPCWPRRPPEALVKPQPAAAAPAPAAAKAPAAAAPKAKAAAVSPEDISNK